METVTGSASDSLLKGMGAAMAHCGEPELLVVDDDGYLRQLVTLLLMMRGYAVTPAADGEEGVALVHRYPGRFDLVLLDVAMPRLDGRQALELMKLGDPRLRVLFMTGSSRDSLYAELADPSVVGYIEKPFCAQALTAEVERALARSSRSAAIGPVVQAAV